MERLTIERKTPFEVILVVVKLWIEELCLARESEPQ